MIRKTINIVLNVLAWMFGIAFLISSISELSDGNILFAIGLLFGALLLLPPIKKLIINKIPKLNRWMITSFASVVLLASIGIFAPKPAPENTVAATDDQAVIKKTDSSVKTVVDKPVILANSTNPKPIDQQPKALLNQENTKVEVVEPKTDKVEVVKTESKSDEPSPVIKAESKPKPKPEPKPEPVKIADIPRGSDCSGLPRTCGKMANCAQAKKALACGNGRLDRDNDGIPCESIC